MPHKHKRKERDEADFELPPDIVARPLSASKSSIKGKASASGVKKRKRNNDDTPREFARLMSRMKPRTAPHEAQPTSKKRKSKAAGSRDRHSQAEEQEKKEVLEDAKASVPSILPGERLADFSARVDQALPINGLVKKNTVNIDGVKRQRTKLEKKITRMQDEWREMEQRRRKKAAEAEEEEEIEAIMNGEDGGRKTFRILDEEDQREGSRKKGKKGKRRKGGGGAADDSDDDPWAALAKARKEAEQGSSGLIGVHDVVQEPPRFNVQPKEKFKVRDGAKVNVDNVPNASGSLRQREGLGQTRMQILRQYRAKNRKGGGN